MKNYREFIEKNKKQLFAAAYRHGKHDASGSLLLPKDDPWMEEDVWDKDFAHMDETESGEKLRAAN